MNFDILLDFQAEIKKHKQPSAIPAGDLIEFSFINTPSNLPNRVPSISPFSTSLFYCISERYYSKY